MDTNSILPKKEMFRTISLKEGDLEKIEKRMQIAGTKNFSFFCRHLILNGYIIVTDDSKELKELTLKINELSSLINEMIRNDQLKQSVSEDDIRSIKELMKSIWQSQRSIISSTL